MIETVRGGRLAVAGALVLLTAAAFEGVRRCDFVAFDDNIYVYRHPFVRQGLTADGVRWAFGADLLFESPHADYWMPVTVLSRMLDVEVFGLDPAAHHAVNAAFHALNAVLVFLMLERLTGARGRSVLAAAAFAVHPLTVESVAWVSERKNVLSGMFWMLAVLAYARYVKTRSRRAYVGVFALMALGLMAKPTAVTLPLVLLVLDGWPLGRFRRDWRTIARLALEKAPLLALSLASSAVTLLALSRGAHLTPVDSVPLPSRMANAVWSLVTYARQVVWPTRLAVLYPHAGALPGWRTAAALAVIAAAAWLVLRRGRDRPYLATGLAWSVLPLVPVLGLIQSGQQSHADRFFYIPLVGVGIVLAWGAADLARATPAARGIVVAAAVGLLAAWTVLTRAQVERWRSTVSLFAHAVAVTDDSHVAHHNLATALAFAGDLAGAARHGAEAVRIKPDYVEARSALGVTLARQGRLREALEHQREAVRLAPSSADAHFNLGVVWARLGRPAEAEASYAEAVRLAPALAVAHYNWGNLLAAAGRWPEAEVRFREAARLEHANLAAANNLALAVALQGRWAEAAGLFEDVIARNPDHARARVNLGRALRELGRPAEARAQWAEALARAPADPAAAEARQELARLDSIRAPR